MALALQLATSVNRTCGSPWSAVLVWLVLWRAKFSVLENVFGLAGLALIVFAVALWQLGPDWSALWDGRPPRSSRRARRVRRTSTTPSRCSAPP